MSTLTVIPSLLRMRLDSNTRPAGRDAEGLPKVSLGHNLLNYLPRGCFLGWPLLANFHLALEISEIASSQVSPPSAPSLISSLTQKYHHALSVIMSVGSPALAAYSLVITARNTRMVKKRAISSKHEARQDVVKVLIALQQQPHKLTEDPLLLPSIPDDDSWRKEILRRLDKKNGWSLATASIVIWVVIAFCFTFVGSFISLSGFDSGGSDGLAVGTLWFWLLCLVVGWLRVPIYSSSEIKAAIRDSNKKTAKHITKKIIRPARIVYKLAKVEYRKHRPKQSTGPGKEDETQHEGVPKPTSNLSPSAAPPHAPTESQQDHSRITVDENQSAHRSSTGVERPAGILRDAEVSGVLSLHPEADKLLIPVDNVGWLHSDEFRHPPMFNYSRIMGYHVLVDDVFKALDGIDPVEEVSVSGKCPMTEIVSSIFNRNQGLSPRTQPLLPRNQGLIPRSPPPPLRNVGCFLRGRDGR